MVMTSKKKALKVDKTAGHESPDIAERRRAEETLRKSEERYRVLFTSSRDAIMTLEPPAWKFTSGNPACVEMFRTGDEKRFVSTGPWELSPEFQPDGRPSSEAALAMIETAMRLGSHFFEWRHRRFGGEEFPASVLLTRVELEGCTFLQATVRELTERKRAEARIAQLDRARAILGGVDHAIVHIRDQQKLLDEICRVAVEHGGFKLAWVGMVAPDRSVQPVAQAGATGYLDGIRVMALDVPEGRGPVGLAIRENRPVVVGDIYHDARMDPWRQRAQEFGLRYAAAFPLRMKNKVIGSFQAYSPQPDFYDEDELGLLIQVSDEVSFALTAIADADARKQAEEQLRKLSQAVEQSPASIVITDLAGAIEYVNPKFTDLTGYTADEVHGKNPRLLKSGEMPAEEYQRLWQTITQGREWRGQFHNRKKSGELFWEAASISPIRTADGRITHFVAVKEDITERKKADQALRESEARYRLVADNIADFICRLDPTSGRFSYVSPSVQGVFGYTPEEALAKSVFDVLPADCQKKMTELLAVRIPHFLAMPSGTSSYRDELDAIHKNGSIIAAEITSTFMRDELGKLSIIGVVRDITKRRLAEEALRQSEERFHLLANATYEGICISENGRIYDVNDQLLKMLGCERDEMVAEDVLNFVAPDSRNTVAGAIRTGREEIYEHQMRRKDGSFFYVETKAKMMRIGNRNLRMAATRDITERRRAQEALLQSQQRYMLAEHATNDGLWDWNILTNEEYFSPRWKEIIGCRDDEVPNEKSSFLNSIHSDDRTAVDAATRSHLEKGERYALEFRLRHKDGSYRWVFSRGEAVRNASGRPVRMVGAITDITERKLAEKAVRENEERFRQLANSITDVFWIASPGLKKIYYVSPGYERIWGRTAESLYANPNQWFEAVLPEDQRRINDIHAPLFAEESANGTEYRIARPDGAIRWVLNRGFQVRDASGKVVRLTGVSTDITERKRLEGEILAERERLGLEVLRRIEMEQERIGRDLHDGLCQILVGAKYRIGVLEKMLTDKNQPSAAAEAKVVERMINNTIQEARDLAKGLNPVNLGAKELVYALEELAKEVETTGSIRCTCRFHPATPILDPNVANHLYRITQEAVQNAIKHGKARKISINLRELAGNLVLTVKDDGVGFSANPEESTGAGLHNIRTRTAMIGGTLTTRPGSRGGSVVSVSLPATARQE